MNDPSSFSHEAETMENGELRIRLKSPDGNNYVRTEAGPAGMWQKAHFHHTLRETYVVEAGWMGYVTENKGALFARICWPGDVLTTHPLEPHNVYLPGNAVIHTVKHGSSKGHDWNEAPQLTTRCLALAEKDLHEIARSSASQKQDERFVAYVELYNNLDRLLWGIPSLLAVAATIVIGFAGSLLSRQEPADVPPVVLSLVLLLVGSLFFLGSYSIWRLRLHHTLAGSFLSRMESNGYFTVRAQIVASRWPPAAPVLILWTYALLAGLSFAAALASVIQYDWLVWLVTWKPTP